MTIERRRFLGTVAATVGGLGLAGCSESGEFESGSDGGGGSGSDGGGSGGGGASGGTGGDGGSGGSGGSGGDGSSRDLELLTHELVREDAGTMAESVSVEGTARNVSGGELSYAEVEVKFYEGDTLAESFLDNVNNLAADETWAFEVMFPGIGEDAAAITDYKIRAGTSL